MKKTLAADIIKRFFMTILFPLVVYIVMYILARRNGVSYFGLTKDMWRSVLVNTSSTAIAALAIWLQVKNKRFDFSGGAVMVLTSIVAGNLCINNGWGAVPYFIL
jgi:ribose transport system permease protein